MNTVTDFLNADNPTQAVSVAATLDPQDAALTAQLEAVQAAQNAYITAKNAAVAMAAGR